MMRPSIGGTIKSDDNHPKLRITVTAEGGTLCSDCDVTAVAHWNGLRSLQCRQGQAVSTIEMIEYQDGDYLDKQINRSKSAAQEFSVHTFVRFMLKVLSHDVDQHVEKRCAQSTAAIDLHVTCILMVGVQDDSGRCASTPMLGSDMQHANLKQLCRVHSEDWPLTKLAAESTSAL